MSVGYVEKQKSLKFVEALNNIMEVLDELKEHIPEGAYLTICNNLKVHHDLKEHINNVLTIVANNSIVKEHIARSRRQVRSKPPLTDEEKIARGYKICNKCDRLVFDLVGHQDRDICRQINKTKTLSANIGEVETDKYYKAISLIRLARTRRALAEMGETGLI